MQSVLKTCQWDVAMTSLLSDIAENEVLAYFTNVDKNFNNKWLESCKCNTI